MIKTRKQLKEESANAEQRALDHFRKLQIQRCRGSTTFGQPFAQPLARTWRGKRKGYSFAYQDDVRARCAG